MTEQDYETKIADFETRIVALETKVAILETKAAGTSSASPNRPKMPRLPNRIGGGLLNLRGQK